MHEKCPYSQLFWSSFSRIRTEYGEIRSISPHSVRMWQITDQNISEYGHFPRSIYDENKDFRENKDWKLLTIAAKSFILNIW